MLCCLLLVFFFGNLSGSQAYGAQVEVAFDTNAEAATLHYFALYWDTVSRQGDRDYADAIQIDARDCLELSGTSFSCSFDLPLQEGMTYYFSLRNFYVDAEPSGFANEFALAYLPMEGRAPFAEGDGLGLDVDQDGDIDGLDLAAFAAQAAAGRMMTPPSLEAFAVRFGSEEMAALADTDLDADVDGADLAAFSQQIAGNGAALTVWDFAALFGAGQ